jgi:hypothetical protein
MRARRLVLSAVALLWALDASAEFIGISYDDFKSHYAAQQDPMWCWAASTQMVLDYQGVKVPQNEIVMRVKGALSGAPGSVPDMIHAANGLFTTAAGQVVVSGQYVLGAPLPNVLYNQMKNKRPVILTYITPGSGVGHAIVVTGVDAAVVAGQIMVSSIFVFDPFSYQVSKDGWGNISYTPDPSLIAKKYPLTANASGVYIPVGIITGVVLVDGTKL